jgi:transketolase
MSPAPKLSRDTWQLGSLIDQAPVLRTLADTLADLVDEGHPIVACTADLKHSNGLVRFEERHPERFFQFGISEQNMVTAAAGMATTGLEPYVATFASFLALLCAEQIRTDVAYTGQRVRLVGHHAGITLGFYGTSHHATEDLAVTRAMAGMTVLAPADAASLAAAVRAATDWSGPIYLRLGRGREPDVYRPEQLDDFEIGKAIEHGTGGDLTILATGSCVHPALEATGLLRERGYDVGLVDVHTVKPLDAEAIRRAAARSAALMTVEEHSVIGGLGGAVAEALADNGTAVPLRRHGLADTYSLIGPPTHLMRHYRLDGAGIAEVAGELLAAPRASADGRIARRDDRAETR